MSDDIRKTMTPEMEARRAEAMRGSHIRPGLRFGIASRHWDHTRTVVLGTDGVRLAGEKPWGAP